MLSQAHSIGFFEYPTLT